MEQNEFDQPSENDKELVSFVVDQKDRAWPVGYPRDGSQDTDGHARLPTVVDWH